MEKNVAKIMIDPGHGGKDPGAKDYIIPPAHNFSTDEEIMKLRQKIKQLEQDIQKRNRVILHAGKVLRSPLHLPD